MCPPFRKRCGRQNTRQIRRDGTGGDGAGPGSAGGEWRVPSRQVFHLTPLVDSIADAEFFFNSVFAPLCMMRGLLVALAPPRRDLPDRGDVDRADGAAAASTRRRGYELVPLHGQVRAARAQHRVLRREPPALRAAWRRRVCARWMPGLRAPCSLTPRTRRRCSSSTTRRPCTGDPERSAVQPALGSAAATTSAAAPSARARAPVAHHRGRPRPRPAARVLCRRARLGPSRIRRRRWPTPTRATCWWVRTPSWSGASPRPVVDRGARARHRRSVRHRGHVQGGRHRHRPSEHSPQPGGTRPDRRRARDRARSRAHLEHRLPLHRRRSRRGPESQPTRARATCTTPATGRS